MNRLGRGIGFSVLIWSSLTAAHSLASNRTTYHPAGAAQPFFNPPDLLHSPQNYSVAQDVSAEGKIRSWSEVEIQRCVISGFEQQIVEHRPLAPGPFCFSGYTQLQPPGSYDVRGISPTVSFDQIGENFRCYVGEYELERSFSGSGHSAKIALRCAGVVQGSEVEFDPWLFVSKQYHRFMVVDPSFSVCGPPILTINGATYAALVAKFGKPTTVNSSISGGISSLWFARGGSRIEVSVNRPDRRVWSDMRCRSELHFSIQDFRNAAEFAESLRRMDENASAGIRAHF